MNDERWMVNEQEDGIWRGIDGPDDFETKEDAITYATACQNDPDSEHFERTLYIGRVVLVDKKTAFHVDANDVVERAGLHADDMAGEVASDTNWPNLVKAEYEALQAVLDEAIDKFIAAHGDGIQDIFGIRDVEEVGFCSTNAEIQQ